MFSRQHQLLAVAVIASLSITACGKKKNLYNDQAATATQAPTDTKSTANDKKDVPLQKQAGPDLGGGLGGTGDLPQPINPNAPVKPGVPTSPPTSNYTPAPIPSVPQVPAPSDEAAPLPPPSVVQVEPVPEGPVSTNVIPDYDPSDRNNVTRDNLTKRMTGGVTSDGLVYTGSSTDNLLDYLRARNERVDFNSRRINLQAAASVLSASLDVDQFSNDALITVKVIEDGQVRVYNLGGALSAGPANSLRLLRAGRGGVTTGRAQMDGTLKCLDLDGGCENMFARLRVGTPGDRAIVNIVFRQSQSDLYFQLPGEHSDSPEYLLLREFMRNTVTRADVANKIVQARINSWEVVNGRSGFAVSMKGGNGELLGFAGPLLAPEAGTGVNINLSRLGQDREDSLDLLSSGRSSSLKYANWIGQARLVANNGLGQVRLAMKMRKRGNYAQDQFAITFMRNIKPLVDLNDDNLK